MNGLKELEAMQALHEYELSSKSAQEALKLIYTIESIIERVD